MLTLLRGVGCEPKKIFKADVDKEHEHREFSGKPMGGFDYGSSWRMLVKK